MNRVVFLTVGLEHGFVFASPSKQQKLTQTIIRQRRTISIRFVLDAGSNSDGSRGQ